MPFHATAIMTLSNEADIIRFVLRHLFHQGMDVHIIDNWSTDGSAEIAKEFPLIGYEKYPQEGPSKYYSWKPLLQRVEQVAHESRADWIVHHDSDEIRRSPRVGESLLDGLARVNEAGDSAINFQVYHFLPIDDAYPGDPEVYFKHFTTDQIDCRLQQVKAWKNTGVKVELAWSGGHIVKFRGIKVHPEKFILKHYPLRSSAQAARKVLTERRYDPKELQMQWHVQYKRLAVTKQWLNKPGDLKLWKESV